MIKLIALDLVGVLLREGDVLLDPNEEKIERMFGPNTSDLEFSETVKTAGIEVEDLEKTTKNIIDKLYELRTNDIFSQLRKKYPNITLIIASNHVSYIRDYLQYNFPDADDYIISAEINMMKPNANYYEYILNKFNIKAEEMLFVDDSKINVEGAAKLGIHTIKIDPEDNVYDKIIKLLSRNA